jgi:hypothetical protein
MHVPTIGIGASSAGDGQILVSENMLGLFDEFTPRFVKRYDELAHRGSGCGLRLSMSSLVVSRQWSICSSPARESQIDEQKPDCWLSAELISNWSPWKSMQIVPRESEL